ncbi:MAG: hypothetical protein HY699_03580 [Deltaproteobacteria bacterium]|nr:hypothetical protein [Deltaproteobacteria bacterium]
MSEEHQPTTPTAIEQVVATLEELAVVFGEPARAVIPVVRARLIEAMAARDRGDRATAIARISEAMHQLAGLADRLDPAEAVLMRALAQSFRSAMTCGDQASAEQAAAVMFEQSGARPRKRS